MKIFSRVPTSVARPVISSMLLICSAGWFVGAYRFMAGTANRDWSTTSLGWMLLPLLTPAIVFSLGYVLLDTRQRSRFSGLDWCALAVSLLPVTVGSFLAAWEVKLLFWSDYQSASMTLKAFGVFSVTLLAVVTGAMIWRHVRNHFSHGQSAEKKAA